MDAGTKIVELTTAPSRPIPPSSAVETARRAILAYRPSDRETALGLVLAVVIVFAHALYNDFVQWDDPVNLLNNRHYRGLGWEQIRWMLSATLMGHYIPLTWLTFGLDYVLWGMEPAGYHFTNLVLHAGNVVLFFLLARRLLPRALPWATVVEVRAGAALAALFFGIHPLRAESVAWVTERRDVLSGLMFLACILCYVASTEHEGRRRGWRLGLSLALFALALVSKSITMTLPFALLVLDFYPLRRLPPSPRAWLGAAGRRVLLEKVPFFVLAFIGARVAYWAVEQYAFFTSTVQYPLLSRVTMALYSVCFYIAKTVLPVQLSPIYELPAKVDIREGPFALAVLAATLITVSLLALWRVWPAGCAAYVYYAIAIAPVGGLVHAGFQLAHDRYSYLSCLGFALLTGAVPALLGRARAHGTLKPGLVRAVGAAIVAWVIVLGTLTWEQVRVWRSTESLWIHAATAEPGCSICHNNFGALLVNQGNAQAALEHFAHALELRPDRHTIHGGLGLALVKLNRVAEAETHLRRAIEKESRDAGFLNNLGKALLIQGRHAEAEPYLRRALAVEPDNVMAHANLGVALAGSKRLDAAVAHLRRAAELDPFWADPRAGLVRAHLERGNLTEARKHYTILRQLHPKAAVPLARHFAS